MPTRPSDHRTSPTFMPFFSVDQQTGTFGLNSEGSVANAKLQQLLIDQDRPRRKIVPEFKLQEIRQESVNIYYEGEKKGDLIKYKNGGYELPMLASPQRVHLGQGGASWRDVESARKKQAKAFGSSFMHTGSEAVYQEIDKAIALIDQRRDTVRQKQQSQKGLKLFSALAKNKDEEMFSVKEKKYVYAPLHEAVKKFNDFLASEEMPLQLRWREFWKTENDRVIDLFMIYPNDQFEAKEPMSKWKGMRETNGDDI